MRVQSPGQEDPLEEGMVTHSSILAWRIPTDRGIWQATVMGRQRVRHNCRDLAHTHIYNTQLRGLSTHTYVSGVNERGG